MRAVKRCTVKYAVIESDVLALLLRDFLWRGGGHENRVLVEREPKKDEMFLGGAIGLYIVEEGRRERTGGGGEKKKGRW